MTVKGHIFISWEEQSSWKCAGCFSCSFFPPRVLETFWGRVFLLPHLLPDVCQVVRRPQSLPPLRRRVLALPRCCWLPVSGEAAKTTNKTHRQTDTVMFVWLQPRLWRSHQNKVTLFIMRMMMVTSVNICRDKAKDTQGQWCHTGQMQWWNDEMMKWWVKLKAVWTKRNTRVNELSTHAGPPAAAPRGASGTSSSSLKTWSRSDSSRQLWSSS